MKPSDKNAAVREYDKLAPDYDRRWSFYIQATLCETLQRMKVQPGERVLDVGCGTGILLKAIKDSVHDVNLSGVDPSLKMLKIARKRLGEKVPLKQSNAERLPFPDQEFDVLVSTSAFHYFSEPLSALEEMARVLHPSGRLVITDWCDDYFTCRLLDLWLRVFNRAHFRTYGRDQCRRLLDDAGFSAIQIDRYKINRFWGLMTAVAGKCAAQQPMELVDRELKLTKKSRQEMHLDYGGFPVKQPWRRSKNVVFSVLETGANECM